MLRRPILIIGLAVALVAAVTAVALGRGSATRSARAVAVKSPSVPVGGAFAVFRRPPSLRDRLPQRKGRRARAAQSAGRSRLVLEQDGVQLYAVDRGDGQLCLVYREPVAQFASTTCTSSQQAAEGALPPEITMIRNDRTVAYMLMPDGVRSVTATATDGSRRDVGVSNNAVALPEGAEAAAWTTSDGVRHELRNLAPAPPSR